MNGELATPRLETPMSGTDQAPKNAVRASLRPLYLGKIAAIFLALGPPVFGVLFWLLLALADDARDPLHKVHETVRLALSIHGLLANYAVGLLPSLIVTFAYASSRRRIGSVSRLLVAALIGAAAHGGLLVLFGLLLLIGFAGLGVSYDRHALLYAAYAAAAGAVAAFFCAFILEEFLARATPLA